MLKIISFYFLTIRANLPSKMEKFELKVVCMGIFVCVGRQDFAFRVAINISHRKIVKSNIHIFFSLISLKTILL